MIDTFSTRKDKITIFNRVCQENNFLRRGWKEILTIIILIVTSHLCRCTNGSRAPHGEDVLLSKECHFLKT